MSDLPPFDPEWLELEKAMGGNREVLTLESAQASREQFRVMFTMMGSGGMQASDAIHEQIVWMTPERFVKIYTPVEAAKKSKSLPVGLYIHCGGFYAGSVEMEDGLCRRIALGSGIILFSPDYRLCPEDKFPAGHNDVCDAYQWMHDHAAEYGGDRARKAVMGGSGGAALTSTVAVKFSKDPITRPKAVIFAAGLCCDPEAMPEELKARQTPERYVDSPMINAESLLAVKGWLGAPPADPLYSTLLHPDLKYIDHAYIISCEKDPTHPQTLYFHEELVKHGVDSEFRLWKGLPHFFWGIPTMKRSQEFMDEWCKKLTQMLEAS